MIAPYWGYYFTIKDEKTPYLQYHQNTKKQYL
jgi:hypothetical protein